MDCILYARNAAIRKRDKVMGEIYKIITDFNNKIYIGKAKHGTKSRQREHIKRDINNGQYIHNSMLQHGIEHYKYEVIESNITDEKLNDREKYQIKFYNCKVPNGYNETDGGDGGGDAKEAIQQCKDHPKEAKKNRDNARIKAQEQQKENPELFKQIIKKNQIKAAKARRKAVLCIETNSIYESASDAARELNLSSSSHISAVCRGERQTAGGYHQIYIEKESEE